MGNGGDAGAVLGELVQPRLELVEGGQAKEVHLAVGVLFERLQHVPQSQAEGHVPVTREGAEINE